MRIDTKAPPSLLFSTDAASIGKDFMRGSAEMVKFTRNAAMKKTLLIVAAALSLLSACGSNGAKEPESPPALHSIEYDPDLETLDDEYGADAFDHTLDHG